jgi:phage gpG-like protein
MLTVSIENIEILDRLNALAARAENISAEVMEDIGAIIVESIHMNFEVGGRPDAWIPSKQGGKTLVGTGALRDSAQVSAVGEGFVEVTVGGDLPYASILETGGTITQAVTERQRKYFWAQWYRTGEESWKAAALSKRLTINIPPRPYAMIQEEDTDAITELVEKYIFDGFTLSPPPSPA